MAQKNIPSEFITNFSNLWDQKYQKFEKELMSGSKFEESDKQISSYQKQILKNSKHIQKLQDKLKVLCGGYISLHNKMSQEYIDITEKTQKSKLEQQTFEMLQHQELLAGPRRLHSARQHLEMVKYTESELQRTYSNLTRS
uniref:Cell division cycle 5-related protein (Trinotate prediction) n=1 Tax=Myxobolus squamalis TaxID=59785 RepID=A0A6B2FWP0_MYXSQ